MSGNRSILVRVVSCPDEPLLVGADVSIVGMDFVPTNQASIDNPLIDIITKTGVLRSVFLSDVVPISL